MLHQNKPPSSITHFLAEEKLCIYQVIVDGEAFFTQLEQAIHEATTSINLQFLTFEADSTGRRIANALLKAVRRGVKIKLLVDCYSDLYHKERLIPIPGKNLRVWQETKRAYQETLSLFAHMEEQGITIRRTNPPGVIFQKVLCRDHKKLVIIDYEDQEKQITYVGGFNVADHHASWHDVMIKMRGEVVACIYNDFMHTWNGERGHAQEISYPGGSVLIDRLGSSLIFEAAVHCIETAEKRIIVESPYIYGKKMHHALVQAARRGVEVSLIVPLHNNHRVVVLTAHLLKRLAQCGIHVYLYQQHGGMTHAKLLLADELILFGSSNFNQFLAGKLAELSILSSNFALLSSLEAVLREDMLNSFKLGGS